jgi:glycosyltransferase involved in cell wall biosynthesis
MNIFNLKEFKELSLPTESEVMKRWKKTLGEPLVSIICIAYNHERHIHDAIKGFLIQQSDYPFEIIIHDDVSTDNTQSIIKSYQETYPKIIKSIIQKENQFSQDPNRVISIPLKEAKGKYVAICEGDDFWIEPLKLQRQVSYLESNTDFSMCIHNAVVYNLYQGTQNLFNLKAIPETLSVKDVILRSWFSPTASFLFRNNIINLPTNMSVNGDMLLLFLNALEGKIHCSNKIMSVYNYGTINSLSDTLKDNKTELYQKRINLLSYINTRTKYKYAFYTILNYLKIKLVIFLSFLKIR